MFDGKRAIPMPKSVFFTVTDFFLQKKMIFSHEILK